MPPRDPSTSTAPRWAQLRELDPAAQVDALLEHWTTTAGLEPSTIARVAATAHHYATAVHATGADSLDNATAELVAAFLRQPTARSQRPSLHTMHLRRTTVRALHRSIADLGGADHDPTRHLQLPPRTNRATRPLSDDELLLLRTTALSHRGRGLHGAAVVALGETTASTGEIPHIRWAHLDLHHRRIELPGAGRIRPRTGQLTDWGAAVLDRLHTTTAPRPSELIATRAPTTDNHLAQARIVMLVRKLLTASTLGAEADIKPSSLRLWAGDRLRRDGATIDEVARRMGNTSLDATADALDWDWQAER